MFAVQLHGGNRLIVTLGVFDSIETVEDVLTKMGAHHESRDELFADTENRIFRSKSWRPVPTEAHHNKWRELAKTRPTRWFTTPQFKSAVEKAGLDFYSVRGDLGDFNNKHELIIKEFEINKIVFGYDDDEFMSRTYRRLYFHSWEPAYVVTHIRNRFRRTDLHFPYNPAKSFRSKLKRKLKYQWRRMLHKILITGSDEVILPVYKSNARYLWL